MKKSILLISGLLAAASMWSANPKEEFRGAWIHTVHQPQYSRQSTDQNKAYLTSLLDSLQMTGVNAIVFQVRPCADAFYDSKFEPWSKFLSGENGKAPSPAWDPLQFMIDESHKRGMELHAWLNPYRVTTSAKDVLPADHRVYKEPWRFVTFNGATYFDPGLPENREFICNVVSDIISRYDVDAIHMDDYFYPYPVAGQKFPDDASYKKYGKGLSLDDWRRENVNLLIKDIHGTIAQTKPWVRFGISPFGIWRNESSDPRGSKTNGLQNYDDLYADVLLWTKEGWVDYMLPQLYWTLENKRASSLELAGWWDKNANGRHMYFGQDVGATMKTPDLEPSTEKSQLRHKVELSRELKNVQGNCWWPGYSITRNYLGVADSLANDLQSTIALVPSYPWINSKKPEAVTGVNIKNGVVSWKGRPTNNSAEDVIQYVVYKSSTSDQNAIENPENIIAVTRETSFKLPETVEKGSIIFVTALDRVNNESPASMPLKYK